MSRWTRMGMVLLVLGVGLGAMAWRVPSMRRGVRSMLREVGLEGVVLPVLVRWGVATPTLPEHATPLLPAERVGLRGVLVEAREAAWAAGDWGEVARLHALLGQEGYRRAAGVLRAWEEVRDPETGLVPYATHPRTARWVPEHTGADLYPFLLLAADAVGAEEREGWVDVLDAERAICGVMPCAIDLRDDRPMSRSREETIFGASEYVKDGLLAITERLGPGLWSDRMVEVVDAMLDVAYVPTARGPICDAGAEVNGEMLQVLPRLYRLTGREAYLEMAERIAEAYLFDVFPKTGYLPPTFWDFERGGLVKGEELVRYRDHGSELVPGLVELYLLEWELGRVQVDRYREPIRRMLDAVLEHGRTLDGLWYSVVDLETGEPVDAGPVDTWGYLLNAYLAFDLAEGEDRYAAEVERVMQAVTAYRSFPWEGTSADGYADTLESMMYLLPWVGCHECERWVDEEIEVMFAKQQPGGLVEGWYLDGNFVRTALLYAGWRAQGVRAQPWREDVAVGAVYVPEEGVLYLALLSDGPWEGRLVFDAPRHRMVWGMGGEYPRLNETPEWYTVEAEGRYWVEEVGGEGGWDAGEELLSGLPVRLDGKEGRLWRISQGF